MLVILPVHNGGDYVKVLVDSLRAQTDPVWQLVVLENASTDGTADVLRSYADARITVTPSGSFLDIYHNWHRALAIAEAHSTNNPLTTFTGHDDWFYPQFVARAKALAAAHPDATLYQCQIDLVDRDGHLIRPGKPVPARENWLEMTAALGWNFRDSVGTGYFFRARDYVRVGGMPHLPRILHADHLLWLRLTRLGWKCADAQVGCAYRVHAASTSGGISPGKMNDHIEAYSRFLDAFTDEFPEIMESHLGRSAMQAWIGHELRLFDTGPVRASLTSPNRVRLMELKQRLEHFGGRARPDHWSYQNGGRVMQFLRLARLQLRFGVARWRAGPGG